jgi:hypothetical protein
MYIIDHPSGLIKLKKLKTEIGERHKEKGFFLFFTK